MPGGVVFSIGEREKVEFHPAYNAVEALPHVATGRFRLKGVASGEWKVSVTEVPSD